MTAVPDEHRQILVEALRAPSAHNAQAWRLRPTAGGYELHYDYQDYLPADPDDRDSYLAMGAFYENLSLAAQRHGFVTTFEASNVRQGTDLYLGLVSLAPMDGRPVDPLAAPAASRITNRNAYRREPLPGHLVTQLEDLGNVLLPSAAVADLVGEASVLSWKNSQFVRDLGEWMRFRDDSPDGMTPACLNLGGVDRAALRVALRLGSLPAPVARVYARRDVRLTRSSPAVAVLPAASKAPTDLFDAGRKLLRSWVTICAAGLSYCPLSIVIDETGTAPKLDALVGGGTAVAIYRVGFTDRVAAPSNRRSLDSVLLAG
jgi:hypothetical protein